MDPGVVAPRRRLRGEHRWSRSGSARCRCVFDTSDRSIELASAVIVAISFRVTLDGLLTDHAVAVFNLDDTLAASLSDITSMSSSLRRGALSRRRGGSRSPPPR